jgi:hypothetical protein
MGRKRAGMCSSRTGSSGDSERGANKEKPDSTLVQSNRDRVWSRGAIPRAAAAARARRSTSSTRSSRRALTAPTSSDRMSSPFWAHKNLSLSDPMLPVASESAEFTAVMSPRSRAVPKASILADVHVSPCLRSRSRASAIARARDRISGLCTNASWPGGSSARNGCSRIAAPAGHHPPIVSGRYSGAILG